MSGFVASGGAPAAAHINTDPFWPSIDLELLREALRIDSSVTPARLETAAIAAAISVNRELAKWRMTKQTDGYTTLAEVPSEAIADQTEYVHLYVRAVQAATGAEVCERYRSYDTTNVGDKKAETLQFNIDEYRRDQRWAVRDILGRARTTVELI